jgi:crotonobetaine/carnitine-CoA ligase
MAAGATLVLAETFTTDGFVEQLNRHQPTLTSIGAPHLRALIAKPERDAESNHHLREVCFGLNVTEDERQEFERRFDAPLLKLYGTSEHGIFTFQPIDGDRNWSKTTLGKPAFGRAVHLVDDDGGHIELGESGEIAVDGEPGVDVMAKYYAMPERTSEAFTADGLLLTGDVGSFDNRGYLTFETRTKHIIETRGENVSQEEVEMVLEEHPSVAEVAVIGVPHEVFGSAILALIKRDDDSVSERDIMDHAESYLASFKRPEHVEFVDEFPRTSVGKIEKSALEARYRDIE